MSSDKERRAVVKCIIDLRKDQIKLIEKEIVQPLRDDVLFAQDVLGGQRTFLQLAKRFEFSNLRMSALFKEGVK